MAQSANEDKHSEKHARHSMFYRHRWYLMPVKYYLDWNQHVADPDDNV